MLSSLWSGFAVAQVRAPVPRPNNPMRLNAPVPVPAPATPVAKPAAATVTAPLADPPLPGEKEATSCKKYPANQRFRWELRGEVDLINLLNTISPMLCRPFIVPGTVRQAKVTILAPDTITVNEAYRMFLSALESMGLTVQPEGKVLKIIESSRAKESAVPLYSDGQAPAQDQYVTRMLRLEHVTPDELKPVLDKLKGKDGEITPYAPTNTLVITDLATNIARIEAVVRQLDVPMSGERIFIIKLHTVQATEMATLLQGVFGVGKTGGGAPGTPPAGGRSRINMGQAPAGAAPGPLGGDVAISQILPDDRTNVLIIVATDKAYQRIAQLVHHLDLTAMPGDNASDRVHVVSLENANAEDVAATLGGLGAAVSKNGAAATPPARTNQPGQAHTVLFEGDVRVASDKPTNSLVILASGRDFLTVHELIKRLDIARRQVFVEATILEISIDKSRQVGIGYHGGDTVGSGSSQSLVYGASIPDSSVNSLVFNPASLTGLAAGLRGPPIPGADTILGLPPGTSIPSFGVFLQAIQTNSDVNVVSMPHILTTDNEKATLLVGQNLPFPGSLGGFGALPTTGATSTATSSFGLGTSVQRQDVALKMEITPHVNDSDQVRLELDNEISDVANPNFNGLGPSTTKRTVKTVITVRDQQTIVIGGLIKDSVSETVEKVPLLGDIPILGYLFKRTSKTISKQNLLIVLTPYIVKDANDLRRIFERKVRERRDFLERFSAFKDDRDYEAQVDYHRKRGLLEEINRTAVEAELEAVELHKAEAALRARDIDGPIDLNLPAVAPGAWPRPVSGGGYVPGQSTQPPVVQPRARDGELPQTGAANGDSNNGNGNGGNGTGPNGEMLEAPAVGGDLYVAPANRGSGSNNQPVNDNNPGVSNGSNNNGNPPPPVYYGMPSAEGPVNAPQPTPQPGTTP